MHPNTPSALKAESKFLGHFCWAGDLEVYLGVLDRL